MSESRADLSLAAALRVMAPLVELLLREGVSYPRFANALKKTFLEAAPGVLEASSTRVNDSSISTLTGIHRKDVREWRSVGQPLPQAKSLGAVMEVLPAGQTTQTIAISRDDRVCWIGPVGPAPLKRWRRQYRMTFIPTLYCRNSCVLVWRVAMRQR